MDFVLKHGNRNQANTNETGQCNKGLEAVSVDV